ncbi:amylo-alpha-1,6-glucosidase [Brachybacterium sp. EF45031]|nr:amylo-alpha-1,6-glucosidase [Brachybacterium sillae]
MQVWSQPDGSIGSTGAEGIYLGDTRLVDRLTLDSPHADLTPVGVHRASAAEAVLRTVVSADDDVVDPLVTLERRRTVDIDGVRETITLAPTDERPRHLRLRLTLRTDDSPMSWVKDHRRGAHPSAQRPTPTPTAEGGATWSTPGGATALITASGFDAAVTVDGSLVVLDAHLQCPPRGTSALTWALTCEDAVLPVAGLAETWPAAHTRPGPPGHAADERAAAARLLHRSLQDLESLRLHLPGRPEEWFLAAGAPWYFTLFGRDSLIAASLLLPLDPSVAAGTLRTLAARQGTHRDAATAEHPGKILHELRAAGMGIGHTHLPPVYYGTIDATPLWISLLHDTHRVAPHLGLLRELAPQLRAAAQWLLEEGDADGDGLLEYLDELGTGLANQGWKDSGDSIRFADGNLAEGTIALVEVQGYAVAAARNAADLLEELAAAGNGPTPAANRAVDTGSADLPQRLRERAELIRARVHERFWCEDELGPYLALALDGRKQPVDGVASNMGHLLGTGLLDAAQESHVVRRLLHPTMFSGYGVRTLSTTNGAYGPLRYHGGSVWTHDTAMILRGMLREGFTEEARQVAQGLLRAAEGFDLRLPELFSGVSADEVFPPLPYPASCRPQAWAAASAVPMAQALGAL